MAYNNKDEKAFLARFNKAKGLRDEWQGILTDTYDLFLPNRGAFSSNRANNKSVKVFDDTGAQALQMFVNQLKNKLLPTQQRWCKLVPSGRAKVGVMNGEIDPQDEKEFQITLDKVTDIMFNYIWSSNFDLAVLESLQDMSVSTGAIMCQDTGDASRPLNYVAVPCDQLVIEESPSGKIQNVWREWSIKAEEIPSLWKDYTEDEELQRIIQDKPTQKVKIIEGTVYNYTTEVYDYLVFCDKARCKFIYESKYHVSPWIIYRWGKGSNETWGRGVAMNNLALMSQLNRLVHDLNKNNSMAINPPAIINSGAFTNPMKIRIAPNERIITKPDIAGNNGMPVNYLSNGCNFNLGIGMRSELQQQIREAFYLDFFGGVNDPVRSATEISIRNQQMLEQQTGAFSRLKQELIDPLIIRTYYVLKRNGLVPDIGFEHGVMEVMATSPLAQVQDMQDVQAVQQFFATMMGFGEQGMALAAATLKVGDLGSYYAKKFGVPAELLLDERERNKMMQQAQQAMTQMQQQQAQMPQQGQSQNQQ